MRFFPAYHEMLEEQRHEKLGEPSEVSLIDAKVDRLAKEMALLKHDHDDAVTSTNKGEWER